jgi:hypothetical protein
MIPIQIEVGRVKDATHDKIYDSVPIWLFYSNICVSALLFLEKGQQKKQLDQIGLTVFRILPGNDLLFQGSAPQVPSAQEGLTIVFGMGTSGTPPLWSPDGEAVMMKRTDGLPA